MRFHEFSVLQEAATESRKKLGRDLNHLEDYVFFYGSEGANEALDILQQLGSDASDVTIKWDGQTAIYWGRESDGKFIMVGKNGWGRHKSYSSDELSNFIKKSGRGEEWREQFGNDMAEMFDILERSTPESFRGFLFGDVLYHPGKPVERSKQGLEFTPNQVKYTVDPSSDLGKKIKTSKLGVAVHGIYPEFGSKKSKHITNVEELNSDEVVVLGQTYVTHQPKVKTQEIDAIRKYVNASANTIDRFLKPVPGLADMKNIIYTYVNQTSKSRNLHVLEDGFIDWLENSKVSSNKQTKIKAMNENNPKALPAIFKLVLEIMAAKDHIIDQLDNAPADVQASTNGEKGGEGYVAHNSKTKLVPRTKWIPA
jgi:hypothetical protein